MVLYNSNLTNLHNMTGDQIGAYFGYSVASGDLNGDGLDDVIIGAPMWTNYEIMGKFETGKVFVVYQNSLVNLIVNSILFFGSFTNLINRFYIILVLFY